MSLDRAGNLLGALTLALQDRMAAALRDRTGLSMSSAAALAALLNFLEAPTIDRLHQVLGLTSSATVRLVDRLEADGLARRAGADDGRATTVTLTAKGRRLAERVMRSREEVIEAVLDALAPGDRHTLDRLCGAILAGMVRRPGAVRWTCRLCDMAACGRSRGRCPVFEEAKRRYA